MKRTNHSFLVWVSLVFSCFSFNSVAQEAILIDPGLDILVQDEPPLLAPPPVPTYSANNPFANSQYTDIADLAELLLQQGYNVDNYFYSEGFTTGIDGTLGNENVCFRDDTNQIYIGRSDVCRDRAMDSTYSYIQIDKMDWTSGFPDITVLQTGDLINENYTNWSGCFIVSGDNGGEGSWAGYSGGACPNIGINSGAVRFGYLQQTVSNFAALNLALQDAGIETTGYNYSWNVKNWDAGYFNQGNGRVIADPFYVDVTIRDQSNNVVFSKRYDYSYWITGWTTMSGEEVFEDPFDATQLSEIQLSVTGRDLGYWAGYYGPEFANPSIKLNYRTTGDRAEDTTLEDLLFEQQCNLDPLSNPSCPGYNDAMMDSIAATTTTVAETTPEQIVDTTQSMMDTTMASEPVQEVTGMEDPVQEAIADATPDPVSDPVEEAMAEATPEAQEKKATGLSANALAALDRANEATNAAIGVAQDAASSSAGIGLSEFGSVSNDLLGGDPSQPSFGTTEDIGGVGSTGSGPFGTGFDFVSSMNEDTNNSQQASMGIEEQSFGAGLSEMGGAVETQDITGEEALAQANESVTEEAYQVAAIDVNPLIPELDFIGRLVQDVVKEIKEKEKESEPSEEEIRAQQMLEDKLAKQAMEGSTDEDAMAALLGYNPSFRAYQQPQMPDASFYDPKEIYTNVPIVDNDRANRLMNGASDIVHKNMVRQQYDKR